MLRCANRNRANDILSIWYRVIRRITWKDKMKKIAAILMVFAIAGCSGMGMGTSGSSGRSNTGSSMGSKGPSVNQNPVIDTNGNLNIYHGG